MRITIAPSSRAAYKYKASDGSRTTHFGARGYEDYTTHRDEKRRRLYLARHASREDWSRAGVMTAGWLSRHILWEKPTLREAVTAAGKLYPGITFALADT